VLRDESDIIQCIIPKSKNPEIFERAEKLTIESSVKISGELKEDDRAPNGFEVSISELEQFIIFSEVAGTTNSMHQFSNLANLKEVLRYLKLSILMI